MKRIITLLFCSLVIINSSKACSCTGDLDFCLTMNGLFPPEVVILAVKSADFHYAMDVQVIEYLKGSEDREDLRIWGDNGILCRLYTSQFPIGDTLVLGISPTDFAGNFLSNPAYPPDLEQEGDYMLSVCGIYYLHYENGNVFEPQWVPDQMFMSYEEFKQSGCLATGIEPVPTLEASLYPNPAQTSFVIETSSVLPEHFTPQIINSIGQRIHTTFEITSSNRIEIDVSHLPPGGYIVISNEAEAILRKKFIILR